MIFGGDSPKWTTADVSYQFSRNDRFGSVTNERYWIFFAIGVYSYEGWRPAGPDAPHTKRGDDMIKFARWAIILLVGAAAWSAPAAAQTLIRFNSWLPPTHPIMSLTIRPWTDEVAKVTQNRVKFEFTAQSMGPPPNQFDMVKDAVADAAITVHGYTPLLVLFPSIALALPRLMG